jgi:hypothetical protein
MDGQKKPETSEIAIADEQTIRDKIYVVRGVKVMLDFELAEIYGYTTKAFNQQVKNNIEKFDEDFRFQLTKEEFEKILRSKNLTSSWGGSRYRPWCFSESGVYMLMTVLRGELATQQSKALIRIFRAMKDYIADTQGLATQRDVLRLSMQTTENTEAIRALQTEMKDQQKLLANQQKAILAIDDQLMDAREQLNETVKKSDLSPLLFQFQKEEQKEILLLNGEPVTADLTYMDIYSKAGKNVYLVDNYISLKTLNLLQTVKPGVRVTVFSDNLGNWLHASDEADFRLQFPGIPIQFITVGGITHDRYIILDYDEPEERIFLCGSSSKDTGIQKISTIVEMNSEGVKKLLHGVVDQMKLNPTLTLK